MGDENPIRTLGDYSKPSHEGYRNTIELLVGNNVVPLRSDTIQRTIDQSTGGKLRDRNAKESWALLEDLALYDNESWNDLKDFAKPVKAITLPQDVPSTSHRHLNELENQVQRLMEAHLALPQPTQVNKNTTLCEICSGPHNTLYCMEDPEQAFVEYASSRPDEAGCMTRSSTKELLSPFENSEQKFRSKRRLFDTPSLIESNSPEFDHNFDIEEQSEEEVRQTMTETIEQYMSKTQENYGSGVTRPTINQDTLFELKGQFLKELRDNTFSGSEHEDANKHIEKEVILFYNGVDIPTQQILDSKGAIPSKTAADVKVAIQEMAEYSQKWHNGTSSRTRSTETSDGLAAIQAQLNNLG
ncbi:hypothetical protein Tco_1092575 [Tanacetum coccineum]|uniref:MAK10-like protein n=1 Tax=Tanacetum coccineum TaxID=301880 RepID=A0ABQ5ICP1_9ASTR